MIYQFVFICLSHFAFGQTPPHVVTHPSDCIWINKTFVLECIVTFLGPSPVWKNPHGTTVSNGCTPNVVPGFQTLECDTCPGFPSACNLTMEAQANAAIAGSWACDTGGQIANAEVEVMVPARDVKTSDTAVLLEVEKEEYLNCTSSYGYPAPNITWTVDDQLSEAQPDTLIQQWPNMTMFAAESSYLIKWQSGETTRTVKCVIVQDHSCFKGEPQATGTFSVTYGVASTPTHNATSATTTEKIASTSVTVKSTTVHLLTTTLAGTTMSSGAIAGIVIGCAACIGAIIFGLVMCNTARKKPEHPHEKNNTAKELHFTQEPAVDYN